MKPRSYCIPSMSLAMERKSDSRKYITRLQPRLSSVKASS